MGGRGMTVRIKYVQAIEGRNGEFRYYFRKPGMPRARLPGQPGSPEFMAAWQAAALGPPLPRPVRTAGEPGTFRRLIVEYFRSPQYLKTRATSQAVTRGILERFCEKHGHRRVDEMRAKHVMAIMSSMADTPAAANNLLKKLRAVIRFGFVAWDLKYDPTTGISRYGEGTYHTWTEAELAQYEARWPVGTRQRTAYALALYTGQRRADLVAMSWADYDAKAGTIDVVQEKTGAKLTIPVHRDLFAALKATPRHHVRILGLATGQGTSVAAFGNFMAHAIGEAGLPDRCVLHGLRKAAARRLADAGCTAHEIMAITGHKTLSEVSRYTAAADQVKGGKAAITRLERTKK